jgi:hypothetical protein
MRLSVTAFVVCALFGFDPSNSTYAASSPRKPPKEQKALPSKPSALPGPNRALPILFELVRNADFDRIYANDSRWTDDIAHIKEEPIFRQERDLANHRQAAEKEFYSYSYSSRYSELAANAVKEPSIQFLEQRKSTTPGLQELYYRLSFSSPEAAPRKNNSTFIRERVVKLTTDGKYKFSQFGIESDYDVFWEKIPQRVESVELWYRETQFGDSDIVVTVTCTGDGDALGQVTMSELSEIFSMTCSDSVSEASRSVTSFDLDDHREIRPGASVTFSVSLKFSNGTRDKVFFDARIPENGKALLARGPEKRSLFEVKAEQINERILPTTFMEFSRAR